VTRVIGDKAGAYAIKDSRKISPANTMLQRFYRNAGAVSEIMPPDHMEDVDLIFG
jgi:hypothetical protein